MNNQIIDLGNRWLLYMDWQELEPGRVTVKGLKPFQLLPGLTEVSGTVVKIDTACEMEDCSKFLTEVDITIADDERHLNYTVRVRYREEHDGYALNITYYDARLHSVASQDLPCWADSFEEKERVEEENKRFPDNF